MAATLGLYFSLDPEADSDIPTDYHFTALAMALEGYHVIAHENCPSCKSLREARAGWLERILERLGKEEGLSNESSAWAKTTLGSVLGPSLAKRLEELYDEQPSDVQELLGDRTEFIRYIVGTRNRLFHGDRAYDHEDPKTGLVKLWRATKKLRLMLVVILLRQLEMPDELVMPIVANFYEYQLLKNSPGN
jgi:hypothetical protein